MVKRTIIVVLSLLSCECHRYSVESSRLRMDDPAIADQLLAGFYPSENERWRWVAGKFSVALKPPAQVSPDGGRLIVHLFLPDTEMQSLGTVTLHAAINGIEIGSETFAHPGMFDFAVQVSPEILDTNLLPVQFCFDETMPPSARDSRELAGVVTGIDLVSGRADDFRAFKSKQFPSRCQEPGG